MEPTGVGSYNGYPGSKHWNVDSRPLSEATNVLRSFVLQNIVQDNQWEIDRITKYYLYWKFYDGLHYKDFNDGMLSFNYVRAFIDKVCMFLLGDETFTFNVESFYTGTIDKELEKNLEELIMYHWAKSGKSHLAYELLQMGSITGDAWMGLEWEEDEKLCKISVFDSRQCFPMFENGDYNKMKSFMVRQSLDTKQESGYKMFVTKWTKETIDTWYQKDASIDEAKITKHDLKKVPNPYGFMPIVHIKNRPNSASYYGKSDANDILKINKVYNEINQQIKAIIDYHATPTTVITGASAKSLKRGLGSIWSGLPPEANVFNLGLDVDLSAVTAFAKDIKTAMHELSDVPENALGKIQAISNTSASALQITYHPLIQQANLKAITYGEGITALNTMILKMISKMDPKDARLKKVAKIEKSYLTSLKVVPIFGFGFPKDKTDELNRAQMETNLKVASRREIMARMGKTNIPDLLEEIDNDLVNQAVVQARINMEVAKRTEGNLPNSNENDEEEDTYMENSASSGEEDN